MFDIDILNTLMRIPGILIGFVFHEFAHALMADKLGDSTPRSQGRISLDPRVHIDIIGFIMILIFRFGWAKPVMTNPRNYKKPRRDGILVSLAGPFTNLLIAIVFIFLYRILNLTDAFSSNISLQNNVGLLILNTAYMNILLFVLNLIPFPGFDGYHVITNLFNTWKYRIFNILEQYGTFIFIFLAITGVLSRFLMPMVNAVYIYLQVLIV